MISFCRGFVLTGIFILHLIQLHLLLFLPSCIHLVTHEETVILEVGVASLPHNVSLPPLR